MNDPICEECQKIKRELREAWAEAWLSAGEEFRTAWVGLIGGTEEDAVRAEEIFPRAKIPGADRVRQAVFKKFRHEAQTGHKIPLRSSRP